MYYLFSKKTDNAVPRCTYNFNNFKDFYNIASSLTRGIRGKYNIKVKSDSLSEVKEFINNEERYSYLDVYIEVSDTLMDLVQLSKPGARRLSAQDNYEVWKDLISKFKLLFDTRCADMLYWSIEHTYEKMYGTLSTLSKAYGYKAITKPMIEKFFILDETVYPRNVCISYIRMDRFRKGKLTKCLASFGNDITFYAIRKNVRQLLDSKLAYLKTGRGSDLIKSLELDNILKLTYAFESCPQGICDVYIVLNLYEKGDYINAYLQQGTT